MMGHGFFGGMWLWPVLLIVVLIAGSVLIRGFGHGCCDAGQLPHKNADEILRERYARGEISKDEFQRVKGDLNKNNP